MELKVGFFQTLKHCACTLVNLFETGFTVQHIFISSYSIAQFSYGSSAVFYGEQDREGACHT